MILNTTRGVVASVARVSDPYRAYSSLLQDTHAGRSVTPESALGLAAVYGAVSLVSNICGVMPLEIIDTRADAKRRVVTGGNVAPMLRYRPNEDMSAAVLWSLVFAHLMLRGNAYLAKVRNAEGQVSELYPIDPTYVHPFRGPNGQKLFRVAIFEGTSMVDHVLTKRDVLHVIGSGFGDGLQGASPIAVVRNRMGVQLAQSEYQARSYGDGMLLKGALTVPGGLTPDGADSIKRQWRMAYGGLQNSNEIAVLHSGATFSPVSLTPEDAQFIETMRWGHTEVATVYNIPASYLNGEGASLLYENRADNAIQLHQDACLPKVRFVESALNMDEDLFGYLSPWVPRFNESERLRPDQDARGQWYKLGREFGWLSTNDVRLAEGLDPIDGGDDYGPVKSEKPAPPAPPAERHLREHRPQNITVNPPSVNVDIHVPDPPAPVVTVPDTVVHVAAPEVRVMAPDAPQVHVDVHVPESPAPVVTVEAPTVNVDVAAPSVNVTTPEVHFEPEITVQQQGAKSVKFSRDHKGQITGANVEGE